MELDKFAPDFVALQADLAPVDKSAANPFFKSKYAPLPEVRQALQPLLAKHNFGLATLPAILHDDDGRIHNGLRFMLIHASGQFLEGEWILTPTKNDSQGQGADVTYKRRFGEMAITGLVADEDDDGNRASHAPAPQLVGKRPKPPQEAKKTDADVKRDQLREISKHQGWDLKKVAALYASKVNGGGGNLATASAEDIEAFITSLEAGVLTVD